MEIILGIDPGSRLTGFGVIEIKRGRASYITSGCVRTCSDDIGEKLVQIFSGIQSVIADTQPTLVSIEQIFFHKNANSALKLGQARGVAICAAGVSHLPVFEYPARQVKQAVVGFGAASKVQVQQMVKSLLALKGDIQEDAADGLAIALCHAHSNTRLGQLTKVK